MPKKNPIQEEYSKLDVIAAEMERTLELARQLGKQKPTLGFAIAFVIAGDLAHAERIDAMFQAGELKFKQAWKAMGSYARFQWVVAQLDAGKVTAKTVYKMLPHLWAYS